MKTETIQIFQFDELTDRAKDTARAWYREASMQDEWWDRVYEDAEAVAACLGVTIGKTERTGRNGRKLQDLQLFFSGFCSQGDGASFKGSYKYRPDCLAAIADYAPQDARLAVLAGDLAALGNIGGTVTKSGNYAHSGTMQLEAVDSEGEPLDADKERELLEVLRRFADWIYSQLEKEYEHLNSDECVDENIRCNEYDFTASGRRWVAGQ